MNGKELAAVYATVNERIKRYEGTPADNMRILEAAIRGEVAIVLRDVGWSPEDADRAAAECEVTRAMGERGWRFNVRLMLHPRTINVTITKEHIDGSPSE